ncbi:MAG: hypothetical protein HQK55_19735, partial [Deltaproteobacteria bacterium]|nr:hypothetical protein [Deltaproteobacteria bacterium]
LDNAIKELWRWADIYWKKEPVQALVDFLAKGETGPQETGLKPALSMNLDLWVGRR